MTRQMVPLQVRAEFQPDTIDEEKRTVDVVWTTGSRVRRNPFFGESYQEELSLDPKHVRMERLRSGTAPLLDAHNGMDLDAVIGVVQNARLEKGKGTATIRFAKAEDDERADAIFRKVKDGIIANVSVGYRVHKMEKTAEVDDDAPVYRATDWEPFEVSLVPIGADAAAGVRAENAETYPCTFVDKEERNMKKPKDEVVETEINEEERTVDEVAIRREAVKAERERISMIQRSAVNAGMESSPFVKKLIEEGVEPGDAAIRILEEKAKQPVPADQAPVGERIEVGEAEREKWLRGAEHALLKRASVDGMVTEHAKKNGETLKIEPGEFRGMSLLDLARQSLERAGAKTRGLSKMDLAGKAFMQRSAYQSTSDFATLLENVMHKTLLAAYGTMPDTWSLFCKVGSVSDFKAHPRYRQGSFGRLKKVNEHGEFQNQAIPDGKKETITAETKGSIIGISRQSIVNDDMGAFNDLATRLGRAARLSIEMDVYDLLKLNTGTGPALSDTVVLFHSTHKNVGTGAAISMASLYADRTVMAEQTDPSGNEILDLRPAILVLPIGLGGDARSINEGQFDPDTANKLHKINVARGMFRTIVDTPRLTGTRRYMFADPAVAPVIEVAFLDGQQAPVLESQEGFRVDGVEWKARLDYGVAAIDFRGAVMNAGT